MSPDTAAVVGAGDAPKGDVLGTARIAGIQAAKRTAELIPLCHPLPLTFLGVEASSTPTRGVVELVAEARTTARTGVEMEALTAAPSPRSRSTTWSRGSSGRVEIAEVVLLEKSGGKSDYRRAEPAAS